MKRGFIQGTLWALVLGLAVLSFVSLSNEQPVLATGPAAPQLSVPALAAEAPSTSVSVSLGEEQAPRLALAPPSVPEAGAQETAPVVTTEPAAQPETGKVETTLDVPANSVTPELSSTADTTLSGDAQQALTTVELQDTSPPVPQIDTNVATAPPAPPEPTAAPPSVVEQETVVAEAEPATEPLPEPAAQEPAPVAEEPAPVVDEPVAAPSSGQQAQTPQTDGADPAPEVVIAQTEDDAPAETGPAVRINRPSTATEEPTEPQSEAAETDAVPTDAPALQRYAAPFENPDNLPLISVVLVDDNGLPDAAQVIAALPFQPTVVVDALADSAGGKAASYRAAGVEVAMQLALPSGAQPVDVEVAFEAAFGIVSEAAMLFSDGTGLVQDNRRVTAQVMQILADDGRGFVSVQRGLGGALRAASQESVASAEIMRDLDGAEETAGAIARALDQAAFRARQTGTAVVMGRMTPQTLQVLSEWSADLDTDTLLIAPVSAILLGQAD